MNDAKTRLQDTARAGKQATQQMADDVTRLGGDFRQLPSVVDDWIGALKSSTPQNLAFSQQVEDITAAFKKGDLSAKDAARALEDVRTKMDASRPASERLISGFKSFAKIAAGVTVAVGGAVVAVKKLLDLGEQGAAVMQTAESFGYLMEKVGASTDLLGELSAASGHTVDDMTLMSSTATLLAGAQGELATRLAESTPELLEIAKAANKLNPTLGDTTYMYQSLALGIKRASPLILDNLGLTIKVGDANKKMADSLGKSVEELTAEEQKMALLNATLEAGQVLIDQVGGNTDSATDSFGRLRATSKNLGDTIKSGLAPAAAGLADVLSTALENVNDFLDGGERLRREFSRSENAALKTAKSYEEYKQRMIEAAEAQGKWVDEHGQLRSGQLQVTDSTYLVSEGLFELTQIVLNSKEPWQEFVEEIDTLAEEERKAKEEAKKLEAAFGRLNTLLSGPVGKEYDSFIDRQRDLRDRMGEVQGKIDELNGKEWLTDAQEQELTDLKGELDELKTKYGENADAHEEANKRILYDLVMQRAALTLTGEELYNFQLTAMEQFGLIDGHTRVWMDSVDQVFDKFETGKGSIDDVGAALAALPKSTDIFVNVKVTETYTERLQGQADAYAQQVIGGLGSSGNYRGGAQEGFATGVSNFVVPPGYPNDSFMVGLTSGEVVNVEPAGGGTVGRGGVIIEEVHIHNEMDYESLFYRFISDPRLERL